MLTAAIFLPLLGALVVAFLPNASERRVRSVATAFATLPMALMVIAWWRFQGVGGFELVEAVAWIPTLGVGYAVGVDGVSLALAAMTALVFLASIIYPVDLKGRAREYFAIFLFLETVSLGVFLALDLFLFYVFWDLTLVGMYFLIGAWGHGEAARRSALKFFLYTLAASLAMLLAILGLYLATDPHTFDMAEIIRHGSHAKNHELGPQARIIHRVGVEECERLRVPQHPGGDERRGNEHAKSNRSRP